MLPLSVLLLLPFAFVFSVRVRSLWFPCVSVLALAFAFVLSCRFRVVLLLFVVFLLMNERLAPFLYFSCI